MTILSNTFAVALASVTVAWAGLTFTGGAQAETVKTFRVAIEYDRGSPAEVTYASIWDQAASACSRKMRRLGTAYSLPRQKSIRACAEGVVDQAVAAIARPELAALHNKAVLPRQVATR